MSQSIAFELAGPQHESEIRQLLREIPLGGSWSLALAREPDGFGGPHLPGERQDFILARDTASGDPIGLCERVVRPSYVGGELVDLPYLGALRVSPSHRHRLSILRGGFSALREHSERPGDFPVALTSITTDNSPARRVLTAGLRGLPTYTHLADFATFALRPRRRRRDRSISEADPSDLEDIAGFLDESMRHRDLAPRWDTVGLAGLSGARFLVLRERGRIDGVISVWDQRPSRQTILLGAPGPARLLRTPANAVARLAGLPSIPRLGQPIDQVFLSHLVTRDDCPERAVRLIRAGLAPASGIGARVAILGVPARHRWYSPIRKRFRAIEYRTSLFGVYWPGGEEAFEQIDRSRLFPEVGLL